MWRLMVRSSCSLVLSFGGMSAVYADPLMVPIPTSTGTDTESRLQRIEEKLDKTLIELKRLERMIKAPPPSQEELSYAEGVYNKIKLHWTPPATNKGWNSGLVYQSKCVVNFKIDTTGKISDVYLGGAIQHPPNPYEKAALDAVKKTEPLPAPPLQPHEQYMELHILFANNSLSRLRQNTSYGCTTE